MERFRLDRGGEWSSQCRAWLFIRIAKGSCYWIGPGAPRTLESGQILVVPPNGRGVLRASQVADATLQAFTFDPTVLTGFFTYAERHRVNSTLCLSCEILIHPPSHSFAKQFENLTMFGAAKGPMSRRAAALALAAAFFDELLPDQSCPSVPTPSAVERFRELVSGMPDVELVRLSSIQLAEMCGCSPAHFSRMFKRHFGVSARARRHALPQLNTLPQPIQS